ncbi:Pentatricopeptide repeat-containing protein [Apostasia shenzhenica]|uniref:Pentatricopeptide repeat-containing protein n=1 Tax=Apostasia shenzhenica TaxID=1088818 RepID=A0A2I0ALQ1_9ASPA|nr:Pentatricopeptide repeat-containing protein [Apostasia shenzhenica]
MVSCYALNGRGTDAYKTFDEMRLRGFAGDGFTFSALFSSCGSSGFLDLGKQTHGHSLRMGLEEDVVLGTSLVDMYAKCLAVDDARRVFDEMPVWNVVSWNSMIVGYGHCGHGEEAMKLLVGMIRGGWKPDELTLSSVLSSCSCLAAETESIQLHGFAVKSGLQAFNSLANALIISYAKCGNIQSAASCFSSVPEPDLITFTSMIHSFAFHGVSVKALLLFDRMLRAGWEPDSVAFLGLLSACSHGGKVGMGLSYFGLMRDVYRIKPSSEHYTCIVGLLGRAGYLREAYGVIAEMPFEPSADALGAFLAACKICENAEFAKWAAKKLFEMEPEEAVNYKSMANIYAGCRSWERVAATRKKMREKRIRGVTGCSWMEINGRVQVFVSGDDSHAKTREIYSILGLLIEVMRDEIGASKFVDHEHHKDHSFC